MYTISKEFAFSAAHTLNGLPADHPCSRLHGHNYVIIVELSSVKLDHVGFVTDYRKLDPVKQYIDTNLDHKNLNDVLEFNPTAENIAKYLFKIFTKTFPQLSAVSVKETPKTLARYTPYGDESPDTIGG